MAMKNKTMLFAVFALLTIGLMAIPQAQNAHAAAGTTGNISAGVSSITLNIVVAIKCYNMKPSDSYGLEVNDISTHNWTNSAVQTQKTLFLTFDSGDESEGQVKIELNNGTGSTDFLVIDTIYLGVTSVGDIININIAMDLLVPLLIFGIAILIVGGILLSTRKND